eukprot:6177714-Pleurochrysis_carterae.AAC.1
MAATALELRKEVAATMSSATGQSVLGRLHAATISLHRYGLPYSECKSCSKALLILQRCMHLAYASNPMHEQGRNGTLAPDTAPASG